MRRCGPGFLDDGEKVRLWRLTLNVSLEASPLLHRLSLRAVTRLTLLHFPGPTSATVLTEVLTRMVTEPFPFLELLNEILPLIPSGSPLIPLLSGQATKNLLHLSQNGDVTVQSWVLRCVGSMWRAARSVMKIQFEILFTSLHLRQVRLGSLIALDALLDLIDEPGALGSVWKSFDLDQGSSNLYGLIVEAVCGLVGKEGVGVRATDGALAIVEHLSLGGGEGEEDGGERAKYKSEYDRVVARFNAGDKGWIEEVRHSGDCGIDSIRNDVRVDAHQTSLIVASRLACQLTNSMFSNTPALRSSCSL